MKRKPAVKNGLILDNALFIEINGNDVSYPVRVAIGYGDFVTISPYDLEDDRVKGLGVQIILVKEQMEQLVTLWEEWRDEDHDSA